MNVPMLVMIVGGIVFLISKLMDRDDGVAELGRICFAVGLLVTLLK